jgi:hypothetical protein
MGRSNNDNNICAKQKSSSYIEGHTPEEAFSGNKPNVENLRIF